MWNSHNRKFWSIGEDKPITLTDAKLSRIILALILCDGQLRGSYCSGKKMGSPVLVVEKRYTAAVMIIALPIGAESDFESISGVKLEEPPEIHIN